MQNLRKYFLAAFITMLFAGTMFGQKGTKDFNPEERAAKKAERLTEVLDLSEAQSEKVKAIHLKYGERAQAMRSENEEEDREKMRSARKQMRTDMDAEMKTVLTAEQYQKLQELPKGRKGKRGASSMKGKHHKANHAFKSEKVKPIMQEQRAKLERKISAEDKAVIAQLRAEFKADREANKAKRKAWKKEHEKGERPDKEAMKAKKEAYKNSPKAIKLQELTEKYKTDIDALLTEAEPKIKALKKEHKAAMEKEKGDGKKEFKSRKGHEKHQKKERKGDDVKEGKKMQKKYSRFLLMDPNQPQIKAQ